MRSKLRTLVLVIFPLYLVTCVFPLVWYFNDSFIKRSPDFPADYIVVVFLFVVLFGIPTYLLSKLTVIVKINTDTRIIRFIQPFLLSIKSYRFEDMTGFRFIYGGGRIGSRGIELFTNDGDSHFITQFETRNFLEMETLITPHLKLLNPRNLEEMDMEDLGIRLEINREYDLKRAKGIRLYMGVYSLLLTAALPFIFYLNEEVTLFQSLIFLVFFMYIIYMIYEVVQSHRFINNNKN